MWDEPLLSKSSLAERQQISDLDKVDECVAVHHTYNQSASREKKQEEKRRRTQHYSNS